MTNRGAALSTELDALLARLDGDELRTAVGFAAKDEALHVARRDSGGDLRLSGVKSKRATLGAGFDVTATGVTLNLRPAGLWSILDKGRRAKPYYNLPGSRRRRKRGHRPALRTPEGFRYRARIGSSRGKGTLDTLDDRLGPVIEETIAREMFAP